MMKTAVHIDVICKMWPLYYTISHPQCCLPSHQYNQNKRRTMRIDLCALGQLFYLNLGGDPVLLDVQVLIVF